VRCVNENRKKISRNKRNRQPIGMLGRSMIGYLPTQALAFLAVFVYIERTQRKRLRSTENRALYVSCVLIYIFKFAVISNKNVIEDQPSEM